MNWEFSWWILLPATLSVLYGYTASRAKATINMSALRVWGSWFLYTFIIAFLAVGWPAIGYPLPVLYLLTYGCQLVRLLAGRTAQRKDWFMLNMNCANILTLHLIIIGVAALSQNVTMYTLLTAPFWRTMSTSIVLLIIIIEDLCFLRWPNFSALLIAEADSEEAGPFMAFLWFCAGYLLIDSTLCAFELEPLYPPLFLIGSSAVVMFVLIRFLLHIHALVKNHHLREEHDQLASRLEATQESADTLRQLAERDILTGVFSRRYIMERIDAFVRNKESFSLVFLDLDALKQINDTLGHDAGDMHLIQFSQVLESKLRTCDLLARVGGDEFVVLMPGCDKSIATERIQTIRSAMEQPSDHGVVFRFSYGITTLPKSPKDAETLIREADLAMYQDKIQRHRKEAEQ